MRYGFWFKIWGKKFDFSLYDVVEIDLPKGEINVLGEASDLKVIANKQDEISIKKKRISSINRQIKIRKNAISNSDKEIEMCDGVPILRGWHFFYYIREIENCSDVIGCNDSTIHLTPHHESLMSDKIDELINERSVIQKELAELKKQLKCLENKFNQGQ